MTPAALSYHLKLLKGADLIMEYKQKNFIYYEINTGTFGSVMDQVRAQAPDQADALIAAASGIASFSFANLALGIVERVFAVMFHIGASMIVFYACRDKGRFWLFPLAILLHTAMDFIAGLITVGVWKLSVWAVEGIVAIFGVLTFCGAFFLLYKRDVAGISIYEGVGKR